MTSAVVYTDDGGSTWRTATVPGAWALCSVSFADTSNGWAVGQHGTILHTTDGGATWSAQRSGTTTDLTAVTFVDALHGYAAGSMNAFVETTDGGLTWKKPATNGSGLGAIWTEAIAVDSAGTIWIAQGGLLARSSDGGRHWRSIGVGDRYPVYDLAVSGLTLYTVGYARRPTAAGRTPVASP